MKTRFTMLPILLATTFPALAEHPNYLLTQRTIVNQRADGAMVDVDRTRYTYNKGELTQIVAETDNDQDGVMDRASYVTLSYDERGNRTNMVGEAVSLADGRVRMRFNAVDAYDRRGQLTNELYQLDLNADGNIDQVSTTAFTWDHGNLVELAEHWRGEWPEYAESTRVETRSYNKRGDIELSVVRFEDSVNIFGMNSTTRWTYNARGEPVSMVIEHDFDGDGIPDGGLLERTFVCDRRGLVTEMLDQALLMDGTALSTTRTLQTFDQHRCLTRIRVESDDGADGIVESAQVTTDTYIHR